MLSFSTTFILFIVLLLSSTVCGVCQSCFGEAAGCDGTTCPWTSGVAANTTLVASLAAGTALTTGLAISKLLPFRFTQIFNRSNLNTIASLLYKQSTAGTEFDPSGKPFKEMVGAIRSNVYSKSEAVLHITEQMENVDTTKDDSDAKIKKLAAQLQVLKELPNSFTTETSSRGVYLFVLAKLSSVICFSKGSLSVSLDVCLDCDDRSVSSASSDPITSSSSNGSKLSAVLTRPKTVGMMMMLLNDFVLFLAATGIASPLLVCPFLSDVVFIPVCDGTLDWPVAFELLIIYLREIERTPEVWHLGNVYAKSGAIDVRRAEATSLAKARYPANCFRSLGGSPGTVGGAKGDLDKVTTFNSSSKRGCVAWNNGVRHEPDHVDANGRCKFFHGCNQWVTDKGKNGQCLGDHKRGVCDYDESKKCKTAAKS